MWKGLAKYMLEHAEDYLNYVPYFMKRLNISEFDARVLSIHFGGMGPEAIAIKMGRTLADIRSSFDRIMAAYSDSGIVVDDTIFTEDPFGLY